ncbi:hypothetical protein ACQKMV_03670 [Lysinibacillus sp. NPDC094403]|uniref:hypothetical protein n=1 Tax=Lysinibacillus sp. NPDC094403 TaxID=3390581 RepID=UPI003CFF3305
MEKVRCLAGIFYGILAFVRIAPKLKIINLVNQYSFGMFLIHWLVQEYLVPYTAQIPSIVLQVLKLFLPNLVVCIFNIKNFVLAL